ncbi:MAG: hypothetical protein WAL47_16710 [Pyrinomonadaceae bacterium]
MIDDKAKDRLTSGPPHEAQRHLDDSAESKGLGAPAKKLIEVMGRKLVVAVALCSFLGGSLLCLLVIFYPTLVPSQTSRFFLCLFSALLFSMFVFTLYPSDYRLDLTKKFEIPIVLIGPAALWIALFFVFWNWLPREDVAGKVFVPAIGSDQLPYSTAWVIGWTPVEPTYYKLKLSQDQNINNPNDRAGFYVLFDEAHSTYTATIGLGPSGQEIIERCEVVFSRSASTYKCHLVND